MILVENAKPVDYSDIPATVRRETEERVKRTMDLLREGSADRRRAIRNSLKTERHEGDAARMGNLPPPPERSQHGGVERAAEQTIDSEGNIGDPWRGLTLLDNWERSGRISKEMHDAGIEFNRLFYRAHLEPLKAADMGRVGGAGRLVEYSGDPKARDRFNAALEFLGGSESMLGSCAWSVIGENHSIRHWAGCWGGWPMDQKEAAGVVKGALGALKVHFGY